ncbi:helix-turn-helix transcriptional regulator [Cupriavidus sp. D39]|uniref:helix-turn-helix transcriptional regulator n=1 Tax=Cupriavidus sp. D39 TaxID=2997877 RepID=UPI003B63A5B4
MGGVRPSGPTRRILALCAGRMRQPPTQATPDHITYQARLPTRSCAVYEALHEFALTQTQRQVLACLIRNGVKQQDPADWIFMKKVTIAQRLRLSEATVYRCLAALEDVGLIEREEQRQTGYTLKVLGRIRLSGQAIRNLGLASAHPSREMGTIGRTPDVLDRVPGHGLPNLAPVRDVNLPLNNLLRRNSRRGQARSFVCRAKPCLRS